MFWQSRREDFRQFIAEDVGWHRARAVRLTWKVYSSDGPNSLERDFPAQGLACEGRPDGCAALGVDALSLRAACDDSELSRLQGADQIATLVELNDSIWPGDAHALWLAAYGQVLCTEPKTASTCTSPRTTGATNGKAEEVQPAAAAPPDFASRL